MDEYTENREGKFTIKDLRHEDDSDYFGYRPFLTILQSGNYEPSEKMQADKLMRLIIEAELFENLGPRASHENAFQCYKHIVMDMCVCKRVPYSTRLLVSQIDFLIAINKSFYDLRLMSDIEVERVMDCKEGIKKALRANT